MLLSEMRAVRRIHLIDMHNGVRIITQPQAAAAYKKLLLTCSQEHSQRNSEKKERLFDLIHT